MILGGKAEKIDELRKFYANAPKTVAAIEEKLGDSSTLLDFWFDWVKSAPSIFFRFRIYGETKTQFVRLEK